MSPSTRVDELLANAARIEAIFKGLESVSTDESMGGPPEPQNPVENPCRAVYNRAMPPGVVTLPRTEPVSTPSPPDPMVKFLEQQVEKLEARLRASEAHVRRYAVACGIYRSEAARAMGLLKQAVHNGGEVDPDAVKVVDAAVQAGCDKGDAIVLPFATEVVK